MILQFKKITLCNFGSYATTTLNLNDKGFCLVSGENHFSKDNALSNGSGKSTIWSAICYALTGETIAGLTSNLKNINIETNECYVTLELTVDNIDYIITRQYKPKSDLKINRNGTDISGKGVRESEKILADNLPDLTKDLIASTIIIGQGMPNKFSSFSPSGRKDLLEKLTKSDFMIEDIKSRLSNRQQELVLQVRDYADSLLVHKTNLTNAQNNLAKVTDSLNKMLPVPDFEKEIHDLQAQVAELEKSSAKTEEEVSQENKIVAILEQELFALVSEQSQEFTNLNTNFNQSVSDYEKIKYQYELQLKQLNAEITKLQAIKDTCPTCGQKLPNVQKPDTSGLVAQGEQLKAELKEIDNKISTAKAKYEKYKADIEAHFAQSIKDKQTEVAAHKVTISMLTTMKSASLVQITSIRDSITRKLADMASFNTRLTSLQEQQQHIQETISQLTNNIKLMEIAKNETDEHVAVVKKMETLIKRDFRGYLLVDIIRYIDSKAKEYCQTVFGTNELDIYLDGNSLDITYCGKMFDNLSGGEKQRCDIILQFAIRDLLQNYLNYSSNILVLDEIFDGLDKISTNKIIDLITNKLKDVESIFIISHHTDELELPVDSEIKVIKNTNGISEVN